MTTFAIVRRDSGGNIVDRLRAITAVETPNSIKPPGLPPLTNKVILRAGLDHDEAFLVLSGDADTYLNDGRWYHAGTNNGRWFEIEIGSNTTGGWLLLNRYKIAAGKDGAVAPPSYPSNSVNTPSITLCHFVCQRYLLHNSPPAAALRYLGVSPAVDASISTKAIIDAQTGSATDKLKGMIETILSQVFWGFGSPFGSGATGSGDITYTGMPSSPEPAIPQYSPGRTMAGLLQFYLDHFPALLRRRYQINTDPSATNSHFSLEAVAYTSGSKDTSPSLCSWSQGIAKFDAVASVIPEDMHRIYDHATSMGNAGALLGGKTQILNMSPDGTGSSYNFGAPAAIVEAVRYCKNRHVYPPDSVGWYGPAKEGTIVAGYAWAAPDGYYNEIEYCDGVTVKKRSEIKRIEDQVSFREFDVCIGKVTSGPTGLDQIIGGFWSAVTVRVNPFKMSRFPTYGTSPDYLHDEDAEGSFEVTAINASTAPIAHADYVMVFRSMRATHQTAYGSPVSPLYYCFPVRFDWEVVDGVVLEDIDSGNTGDVSIRLTELGYFGVPATTHTIVAQNLSGLDAKEDDRCIVLKRRHMSGSWTINYGFFVSTCCGDPADPIGPDTPPTEPEAEPDPENPVNPELPTFPPEDPIEDPPIPEDPDTDPDPDEPCDDETRWFCINETSKEMSLSGDSDTFGVTECCDCESAVLTLNVDSSGPLPTPIKVAWEVECNPGPIYQSGVEYLGCNDTVLNILAGACLHQVSVTKTNEGCAACTGGGTTTEEAPP